MIEVINTFDNRIVGFRFDGGINRDDMERFYDALEAKMENDQKVKVYAEVKSLSLGNITWDAIKEETRRLLNHPAILANLAKAVVVTDLPWVKREFAVETALLPTLEGKSFSFGEEDKAVEWLRADQRASQRLDLTESEMTQVAFFKSAAGFGLGLLAAGLFTKEQRRNLGLGVLLGSVIFSLPISIKVLNNNRQLLGK
ncbi:MAG TPA: STAS/SEC14 domain-containing protein [Pyrinomonadaceae bacterium]|nr:STAS/SEC14 domain-containing protein [Pyrinomonadaceae bacterium]